MTGFIIKQLPYDLTSNAGLALAGQYIKRLNINKLIDSTFPIAKGGIPNSDILKSYLGLLVQGKNDFGAIEAFRNDNFFKRALGIGAVPSSPTMRQRLDTHASSWFDLVDTLNETLLSPKRAAPPIDFGALPCGYMPIDWDTFVMNNDDSKKEDIGLTYQGVVGYAPSATYIGRLGYCLELALRPGTQHSALETELNLERVLPMATRLTQLPLLFRADSGLCSLKIMQEINAQAAALQREIAFIIKWNPRGAPVETIAAARVADPQTLWCHGREGRRECLWPETLGPTQSGSTMRRVYRLTERTIDKHGNRLLLPAYTLEGWTTTLPDHFRCHDIIALYCDHGTHEQFHAEFKSDMDLERLPSGKFATNYLVCALAAVAMNILRLIGQHALTQPDAPLRHPAKRRRVKTVLQELMFKAGRMIQHAGRWVVGLGAHDSAYTVFARLYHDLSQIRPPSPA
jgi:hypothetical protein